MSSRKRKRRQPQQPQMEVSEIVEDEYGVARTVPRPKPVSVPAFRSTAVSRVLAKRRRDPSDHDDDRRGKRVKVEEITDDAATSSSSSSTAIVPVSGNGCRAMVVAKTTSPEEQALRERRKKAIADYCKKWLDKTKESLKHQRSSEVRQSVMERERSALKACMARVNDPSHGFSDVHDVLSLLQMMMRYYQRHDNNVDKIKKYKIRKKKVLAEGRKQFLREIYNIAKEKSAAMQWPSPECNEKFQEKMRAAFEAGEESDEQDRMRLLERIAHEIKAWREKIIVDHRERQAEEAREAARRRAMASVASTSVPSSSAIVSSSSPFGGPVTAPVYRPSVPVPRMPTSVTGGGGRSSIGGGTGIRFTYSSVTISFTTFISSGAGYSL